MTAQHNPEAENESKASHMMGHKTTNGPFAKYLEAENPNARATSLADRFETWQAGGVGALPRIRANNCCPDCGSSDVFYTDQANVSKCDRCGLTVFETDKEADEVMEDMPNGF